VSQISEEAPTGPIRAQPHARPGPPVPPPPARDLTRRWNVVRDLFAGALFIVALFLPWNLYFGFGIPDSKTLLWAVLGAVTLLSLASIPVTYAVKPASAGRLRLILNLPYRLLVIAFIVFDVFQTIKAGGAVTVPGGVGPGAWVGVAGSLLTSQPLITGAAADDASFSGWTRSAQILGYASMIGAALSTVFHLCWRVSYALHPAADSSGFGKQNIAVITTAVVYGVVALIAVLVASRWILRTTRASQLAVIGLGASTLLAGILVWLLPVGRDIDAFHGIAQNTSTAGVGYEGYLAWAAAAAIFAPRALFRHRDLDSGDEDPWRTAARMGLLLITVWCLGSLLMRLTDLFVAVTLNFPYSRYDTMTMAGFDLATAVLAIWLRMNLAKDGRSARLVTSLCGLVVTLSIARVVVGVELAPHFETPPNGGWTNPVYGNNLAQQITSTFDVSLCGLAVGILIAARIASGLSLRRQRRQRRRAVGHARRATRPTHVPAATTRIPTAPANLPTTAIPQMAGQSPRIFRGDDSATRQIQIPVQHGDDSATRQIQIPVQQPKIFRPPGGQG
jgi:hypothetical protein